MASGCSTRTGRVLLSFLFIAYSTGAFSEQVKTTLKPGRIHLGESSSLQIRIEDVEEAEPLSVPAVKGLEISFHGSQRFSSTQIINWKRYSSMGIILSFSVVAEQSGRFVIPPIVIASGKRRLQSKQVSLIVLGGGKGYRGIARFYPEISISKRRVYLGEPIVVRYFLLHRGLQIRDRPLFEKLPEMKGFVRESLDEQIEDETRKRNGIDLARTHVATFILVPTERGSFRIGGGSMIVTIEQPDRFFSFPFPQRKRITFHSESVKVIPLPEKGKPENFQGNVGRFTIELKYDRKPSRVYEEKDIRLIVRGRGNLILLSKPLLVDAPKDIKVISEEGKGTLGVEKFTLVGEKEFIYKIIPERSGEQDIGRFVFNYFDAASARYETLTTEDMRLSVTGDPSRGSEISLTGDETPAGRIELNVYLVALIILAVAAMVASIILWERRRIRLAVEMNSRRVDDTPPRESEISDRKILLSFKRGDVASFLREYEATINLLERRMSDKGGKQDIPSDKGIQEIKDALYRFKYGGESITDEDMEVLYRDLKKLVDLFKK